MTLIMPEGYKDWNSRIERWSHGRHLKRKLPNEIGYPVLKAVDKFPSEIKEKLRFVLPNWFCVDCKETKTPTNEQALSVHLAGESDPALDLKKGEVIMYFVCAGCIHKELWGKKTPEEIAKAKQISAITRAPMQSPMSKQRYESAIEFLRSLSPDDRAKINVAPHGEVR